MNPADISHADTHKARKAYAFNYQNRPFLGRLQRKSPFFLQLINEHKRGNRFDSLFRYLTSKTIFLRLPFGRTAK